MLLFAGLLLVSQVRGAHPACGERPVFEGGPQYSRIIEGVEAEVGEFPWLASIQVGNSHICGGAIISEWWVVTAAHCLATEGLDPRDLAVVLGSHDLQSPSLETKRVSGVVLHKDFERSSMDNDIALLLLSSGVVFSGLKAPICMPEQPSPSTWHKCWVAGWGQTKPGDKDSVKTDLMKAPMVIMDWERCSKLFPKLTRNMLCAGYENESYDACKGDSGGPLACTTKSDKRWYQVGIISWGRSCGRKGVPGIYTLLENYKLWIKKVTEVEGRPYDAEKMRAPFQPLQELLMRSPASGFPERGGPRLRVLLCLLSYVLSQATFYG